MYVGPGKAGLISILRGFKWAAAAMVLTVAAEQFLFKKPSETHAKPEEEC